MHSTQAKTSVAVASLIAAEMRVGIKCGLAFSSLSNIRASKFVNWLYAISNLRVLESLRERTESMGYNLIRFGYGIMHFQLVYIIICSLN